LKKNKNKIIFILLWFIATSVIAILVSLSQMYSREVTLDNVRSIDFRVIREATKIASGDIFNNFKSVSDELSINNKKHVLFPMALLYESGCISNGINNQKNSICNQFHSLNEWKSKMSSLSKYNYFGINLKENELRTYFYERIFKKYLLVGQAGKYAKSYVTGKDPLLFFLKERALKYYFSTTYGLKKIYSKSKYSILFIFIFSLAMLIIVILIKNIVEKRVIKSIDEIKKEIELKDKKKEKLIKKNSELSKTIYKIKEEQTKDVDEALSMIVSLEDEKDQLSEKIIELECQIETLAIRQERKLTELSRENFEKKFKELSQEYNSLIKLWGRSTKWKSRITIEKYATKLQRMPFTISVAFITFEKYIDTYYLDSSGSNKNELSLYDKIEFLIRTEKLDRIKLHNIRKARNEWFHNGRYPEQGIVKNLIDIINNEEPRI